MGKSIRTGKKKRKSYFQNLKDKVRETYFSWDRVFCDPLGKDVLFTNLGWDHLTQETKKRPEVEAIERLKLLPNAKSFLTKIKTPPIHRFQNFHDHYTFTGDQGGINISVVVREYKKEYFFYSIFKV